MGTEQILVSTQASWHVSNTMRRLLSAESIEDKDHYHEQSPVLWLNTVQGMEFKSSGRCLNSQERLLRPLESTVHKSFISKMQSFRHYSCANEDTITYYACLAMPGHCCTLQLPCEAHLMHAILTW